MALNFAVLDGSARVVHHPVNLLGGGSFDDGAERPNKRAIPFESKFRQILQSGRRVFEADRKRTTVGTIQIDVKRLNRRTEIRDR